jgi:pimeloyl-ACP methyl ester carboxylesterase
MQVDLGRRRSLKGLLSGLMSLSVSTASLAGRKQFGAEGEHASLWLTLPATPKLPNPIRQGLAPVNGVKIFFAQFGIGLPVLFLHGGLANSNYWGRQVEDLSRNYLVTVMDTRGHGRSPFISGKLSYEVFAKDTVALMDYLEISRSAVIGWSDGAITGLQLALTQPDRLSGLFAFGANSNLGGLKPGGAKTGVFPSFISRCHKEYLELSPNPDRWPQLERSLGAMWRSEPNYSSAQLATIKLPVTIADGEYDEIIKRENTREIAASIKGARLVILPNVSHFAMLQDASGFDAAVRGFLS